MTEETPGPVPQDELNAFARLLERSSLGTGPARSLKDRTPPGDAEDVVRRANEVDDNGTDSAAIADMTPTTHGTAPPPPKRARARTPNVRRTKQLPPYRAVFAVDTKDFSNSPSAHQEQLRQDIPELLRQALEQCGLSRLWETRVFGMSTGDGYCFGVDATDAPFLVDPFLTELNDVLEGHDELVRARDRNLRLRLRASIHLGPIPDSGLSTAMNETHRLLDADPVRKILDHSDPNVTYVAAILSQRVFTDVIRGDYVKLRATQCAAETVKVKDFEDVGYLYTPTASVNPRLLDGIEAEPVDAKQLQKDQQNTPRHTRPLTKNDVAPVSTTVNNTFSGSSTGSVLQIGRMRDMSGLTDKIDPE